ncbi:MAG: FAD-dependent oxidoreductase [Pseudomonadota bacterium]
MDDLAFDFAVIGAGPAGMAAAATATACGLSCVVIEEAVLPGGQAYRSPPVAFRAPKKDRDRSDGDALRNELARSGATLALGHRLWWIGERFRLATLGPDGPRTYRVTAVLVATGTTERVMPFPGWTTPGVIGLAAATILAKADGVVPGERLVVAGVGPLLPLVVAKALAAGARVEAVVDLAARYDWVRAALEGRSRPDLVARGTGWLARATFARVPWLFRHTVARVTPSGDALGVEIAPVDDEGRPTGVVGRTLAADSLCIGHGLVPTTEITRLLGARHVFRRDRGGWIAAADAFGRTSVRGLYVAGDTAGIDGAAAAPLAGRLAATAVAHDAEGSVGDPDGAEVRSLSRRRAAAVRFGRAMARLSKPRPGLLAAASADVVVCRCEDVTRAEIDAAVAAGARDVNQVKAWTRCGMGPCQGRMCGEAAAELVAMHVGGRERTGLWTGRAPLRPVPLDALIGTYEYGEIAIPKAAPL